MKRIFIADDDEDDRGLFEVAVREIKPEAEIFEAFDGIHFFDTIDSNTPPPPDVIFLDINMPRQDGFTTLDNIKHHPYLKDVPVVILSTSSLPADINKMYDKGASFFITKPLDFRHYKKVLNSLINNKAIFNSRSKENFYIKPYA